MNLDKAIRGKQKDTQWSGCLLASEKASDWDIA